MVKDVSHYFTSSTKPGDYYLQTNGAEPFSKGAAGIYYEKKSDKWSQQAQRLQHSFTQIKYIYICSCVTSATDINFIIFFIFVYSSDEDKNLNSSARIRGPIFDGIL